MEIIKTDVGNNDSCHHDIINVPNKLAESYTRQHISDKLYTCEGSLGKIVEVEHLHPLLEKAKNDYFGQFQK